MCMPVYSGVCIDTTVMPIRPLYAELAAARRPVSQGHCRRGQGGHLVAQRAPQREPRAHSCIFKVQRLQVPAVCWCSQTNCLICCCSWPGTEPARVCDQGRNHHPPRHGLWQEQGSQRPRPAHQHRLVNHVAKKKKSCNSRSISSSEMKSWANFLHSHLPQHCQQTRALAACTSAWRH